MADVLPWVFSQGDRAKRYVGGLLSDPIGTFQQTAGLLQDNHRELQGLLDRAPTDRAAQEQATGMVMNGLLGFAPVGMTAWHGSPHVFDSFNHQGNLGRGDGFQAQGIGTYLAENPAVAKEYAKANGNVYRVDLPDDAVSRMLDFGAPITSQRHLGPQLNAVHEKFPELKEDFFNAVRGNEKGQYLFDATLQKFARKLKSEGFKGDVYEEANRRTTQAFRDAGLAGFKYPDAGSRGGSGGTSNYVVFDDSLLKILDRNGAR